MRWWLVLAAAILLMAHSCTKTSTVVLDTTGEARVAFQFVSYGPVLPGLPTAAFYKPHGLRWIWGVEFVETSDAYLAGVLTRVLWDRELVYHLSLSSFKAGVEWTLEGYICPNGLFYLVRQKPPREETVLRFKVGRGEASKAETATLYVSRPVQMFRHRLCTAAAVATGTCNICRSLDVETGRCDPFVEENVAFLLDFPQSWRALDVEGFKPGDVVVAHGVGAAMPGQIHYTHAALPGRHVVLSTDLGGAAFHEEVKLTASAHPAEWGVVSLRPPRGVPLFISRVVRGDSSRSPHFVVDEAGNATWIGDRWAWNWTIAAVAFPTSHTLVPHIAVRLGDVRIVGGESVNIYVPLGSVLRPSAAVAWRLDYGADAVWVAAEPATYLRAVDNGGRVLSYEELGARGKLRHEGRAVAENPGLKWAHFSVAVDESARAVETAWYSPPDPCSQWPREIYRCTRAQHVFTKVNGTFIGYSRVGLKGEDWPLVELRLVDWLATRKSRRCGVDGFNDFMNLVVGDPTLHFWHVYRLRAWSFNQTSGDWDIAGVCHMPPPHRVSLIGEVYGTARYRNTTLHLSPLYHSTAYGDFYDYVFEGVHGPERPAGWTDAKPIGAATAPSNASSPWLLSVVPATVCNSFLCTALNTTLWGPSPPRVPDLTLPGTGYVFLLQYVGERRRGTVRIYVDRGHVLDTKMRRTRIENGLLAEVEKAWEPFSGVYVGAGWHVDYVPLAPCEHKSLGPRPIYVTPDDWAGPVRVVVEEVGGRRHEFVIFTTRAVSFRIETSTPAPRRFVSPYLNVTAYFRLGGLPYFHGLNALGEAGRLWRPKCVSAGGYSQLAVSGDFWGAVYLHGHVGLVDKFVEPQFEILGGKYDEVKITSPAPVAGYALYLKRDGTWALHAALRSACVLINVSEVYPWDPLLVVPLVEQTAEARDGDLVEILRPRPRLLYRSWSLPAALVHMRGRPPSRAVWRPC